MKGVKITWICPSIGKVEEIYEKVLPDNTNKMEIETIAFQFALGKQKENIGCEMEEYKIY